LQHAWAEIEHDLGYKTALGVPRNVRRQFSRLAGLLEIADTEFASIRDRLSSYERDLPGLIEQSPDEVLLDKAI
jgi:ppGpp synthetase/RelA/SpoT-type nucleotidyltranferase